MKMMRVLLSVVLVTLGQFAFSAKVVVFDLQAAVLKTDQAQKSIEELKARTEYSQMLAQVDSLKADLQALSKEAETKGMTWSAEQSAEQRKKMEYIQADLQLAAKKIQAENNAMVSKLMKEMQPKVEKAFKKIVEAEGIEVVLRAQTAHYVTPTADITPRVTAELNKLK